MPHPDDSFWLAIFRRFPLIATFMAIGGVIGLGLGISFFADAQRFPNLRFILFAIFIATCVGIGFGLIVGVMIDSLVKAIRGENDRDRK